eukprot:m.179732 g.179732  ORF g.179732 m.179732 type:complete len:360 (+) comp17414_c1_seq3:68-1147(+)
MEGDKDGLNTAYVDLETQLEQLNRFGMADAVTTLRNLLADQMPHVRDQATQLTSKLLTGVTTLWTSLHVAKRTRMPDVGGAGSVDIGQEIAKISQISVNCPGVVRGKVDVVFSADYLTLRSARIGDVSIPYDCINSIIHLEHPMPHKKQSLVILRIEFEELPRVAEIVFQLKNEEKVPTQLNQELAKERHPAINDVNLSLPTHNVLVEFIRLMDEENIELLEPTEKPIPCHLKVIDGFLYLLSGGILFLTKILFLPLDEIAKIEISGGATRTFDIMIHLHDYQCFEFTMISRDFENTIAQYMMSVQNKMAAEMSQQGTLELPHEDLVVDVGVPAAVAAPMAGIGQMAPLTQMPTGLHGV